MKARERVKLTRVVAGGGLVALVIAVATATQGTFAQTASRAAAPAKGDWPLHSLDLASSRYADLTEINTTNAGTLAVKWQFDSGTALGQLTPLVVDGVMYFNAGSKMFALKADTGEQLWMTEISPSFNPTGRGPAYGDGRIYAYGATTLYAIDAKTGKPLESFGDKGQMSVVNKALDFAYPGKFAKDVDPVSLGYFSLTTPPTYFNGTLYIGLSHGDSHIIGGLLVALDGRTGAVKWTFNPVPQQTEDSGWDIAKDTWKGGARVGAGIWTPPVIDPQLNLIYFNASNPSPDFDGSARIGMNLFTNSTLAVHLVTGKLVWYYQTIHHDIWDWDHVSGPALFDVQVNGRTVKAIGAPGKTCYVYIWNRENGLPINPRVETPVPTFTDVPGDQVWPTQPIPYTSRGTPQTPFCATYPIVADAELAKRRRPLFHPYLVNEFVITSPGNTGGANYGPPAFSPKTGLFYVTGKNDAWSIKVKPVGDSVSPGKPAIGFLATIAEQGKTGMTPTQGIAAYDPATGERVWYAEVPSTTSAGALVTAGDVLFQGVGSDMYAFDARTGAQLVKVPLGKPSRASGITYQANGRQYVAIAAATSIVAVGLPDASR